MPEGVDDTSIRHSRLQPFVQCYEFTVNVDQGISRYRQPLLLCLVILDEVPLKTVVTDRSCSLLTRVITARTDKKTRFKDDEDIPRSNRKSLTRPASDTSIFRLRDIENL